MKRKLIMLMSALLPVALYASVKKVKIENEDGVALCYYLYQENATVTSSDDTPYSGNIRIPDYVEYKGDNYKVTMIGNNAFKDCAGLTSVSLPEILETIGSNSFYGCSSLTSITFPPSLVSIGKSAFESCSLSDFTLPQGVTAISERAFARNCFKNLDIPEWVTSVGKQAFAVSSKIETVNIPASVKSIGDEAFMSCSRLYSLTIPDGKDMNIGENIVANCNALSQIITPGNTSGGRCLVTDGVLRMFAPYGSRSFTIPSGVTSIGSYALKNCNCRIDIPYGVKSIEDYAFSGLRQSTVIIPETVTKIGVGAFQHSYIVNVYIPSSVKEIGERAFCQLFNSDFQDVTFTVNISNPAEIKCADNIFTSTKVKTLYVPQGSKALYASAKPWSDCKEILEMEPGTCALPEISLSEGKLKVISDTEGSQIITSVTPEDCKIHDTSDGKSIVLTGYYDVSAFTYRKDKELSSVSNAILVWNDIVFNADDTGEEIALPSGMPMLIRTVGDHIEITGANIGETLEVTDNRDNTAYSGIVSAQTFLIPVGFKQNADYFIRVGDKRIQIKI